MNEEKNMDLTFFTTSLPGIITLLSYFSSLNLITLLQQNLQ
jgi:hypothetical protein